MLVFDEKVDLIDRIFARNLTLIAAADSKATLIFGVDSTMLGVLAALIPPTNVLTPATTLALGAATLCLLISIALMVHTTLPRLSAKAHSTHDSLIYFGSIAAYEEKEYAQKYFNCPNDDLILDFAVQCNRISKICCTKYVWVRRGVIWCFAALPFWLLSIWMLYPLKQAAGHG